MASAGSGVVRPLFVLCRNSIADGQRFVGVGVRLHDPPQRPVLPALVRVRVRQRQVQFEDERVALHRRIRPLL